MVRCFEKRWSSGVRFKKEFQKESGSGVWLKEKFAKIFGYLVLQKIGVVVVRVRFGLLFFIRSISYHIVPILCPCYYSYAVAKNPHNNYEQQLTDFGWKLIKISFIFKMILN